MPGRQQTFELVPTTFSNNDVPVPAMTSKAAKKAYQQRKKGPKLSKAEQRRLEAEELDRQKREHERERSANRAKAAREKKAAKEQDERATRKKLGLPKPSKFARASQPTISVFVRNGNKRIWQDMEALAEESEGTVCDQGSETERPTKRVAQDDASEDEFGDFPSLSQSDLPDILYAETKSSVEQNRRKDKQEDERQTLPGRKCAIDKCYQDLEKRHDDTQPLPKMNVTLRGHDQCSQDEASLADMVTTQLLSEAGHAASKIEDVVEEDSPHPAPARSASLVAVRNPLHADFESVSTSFMTSSRYSTASRPPLQERSSNMSPPPDLVSRTTRQIFPTAATPKEKATPVRNTNIRTTKWISPPSATQAFLVDHLDVFLPSPSQEVLELQVRDLLDDIDDLPSNTQIARELALVKPLDEDPYLDMMCTQDLVLSPQDLLEISTPSRPQTTGVVEKQVASQQRPISREKRRFFEEKEEDLLHAALHESKVVAEQNHAKYFEEDQEDLLYGDLDKIRYLTGKSSVDRCVSVEKLLAVEKRGLQRIQSTATEYGDEEFNEQELLALCSY